MNLEVLATQVSLGSQEHLQVLAGSVEGGGQVVGGHLVDIESSLKVDGWRWKFRGSRDAKVEFW